MTESTAVDAPQTTESAQVLPSEPQEPARSPDGDALVDGVILTALARLDARRQRVRDPQTGRWTVGNGGRLETGRRSERFWQDLEPARAEIEQRVRRQLALTGDDAPETALGLIGGYAEARLIRRSEFLQLTCLEDAPATAKQRKRQRERRRDHLSAWASAFDRELKAATVLGLERRVRSVADMSFSEWRAAQQQSHTEEGSQS